MSDADGSPATPQSAMPQDAPRSTGLPPNDAPADAAPSSTPPPSGPPAPERENVIDAVADLLQMLVNWLRQEAAGIMRDKVVLPGQQLGHARRLRDGGGGAARRSACASCSSPS